MQKKVGQYLLTPGPLTTSSLTKEVMQRDVGSWDDDFRKITKEIREKLVEILLETSTKTDTLEADPTRPPADRRRPPLPTAADRVQPTGAG